MWSDSYKERYKGHMVAYRDGYKDGQRDAKEQIAALKRSILSLKGENTKLRNSVTAQAQP